MEEEGLDNLKHLDPTVVKTMRRKIEYISYNHYSSHCINNSKIITKITVCSPFT